MRPGANTVNRRSTESAVTIPYEQTFRSQKVRPAAGTLAEEEFNQCGCGWPQHMLIPKGNAAGMKFDLFVMISNYDEDRVDQDLVGECTQASPYCSVRDRLFPDKKPMGYPLDRRGRAGVTNLAQFLTPNMRTAEFSIVFNDRTVQRT